MKTKILILSIKDQISGMGTYSKNIFVAVFIILTFCFAKHKGNPVAEWESYRDEINRAKKFLKGNLPDSALAVLSSIDAKLFNPQSTVLKSDYYLTVAKTFQMKGNRDSTSKYNDLANSVLLQSNEISASITGEYYFLRGWVFQRDRNLDSAQFYFIKALEISQNYNPPKDSLSSIIFRSLGNISLVRRDNLAALGYYDKSYEIEKRRADYSLSNIAALFQNKGIIFTYLDIHDSAKYYFRESLKIKEKTLSQTDLSLATSFMNFSRFLLINGELLESLSYINKAERIYISVLNEDHPDLGLLYLNKASILILINRFEDALNYLELAYQISKKYLQPSDPTFIMLFNNLGIVYENLGNYHEAIRYYNATLKGNLDSEQRVRSLRGLASSYANLDSLEKASSFYNSAIVEAESKLGTNHWQTAATYHRYGSFLNGIDKPKESLKHLEKAQKIYLELFGKENRDVSNVLTSIGLVYEKLGDHRKALRYYQDALIVFLPSFDERDYYHNPVLEKLEPDLNIFNVLYNKSFSFFNLYRDESNDDKDLIESLNTIELTIALYQNISSGLDSENSRLLLTSRVNEIYGLAVRVTSELYRKTNHNEYLSMAFSFSEKSKASVLLSLIREAEAAQIGNVPESFINKETEIRSEIAQYRNLIFEEKQKPQPNVTRIGQWQSQLNNNRLSYDSLIGVIEKEYPEYYNLKYNFEVISISDIQKRLRENSLLIEYKLVDSVLYSFIISRDQAILREVGFEDKLLADIEYFISMTNSMPEITNVRQNAHEFAKMGKNLYNKLFPESIAPMTEIIIIPDDVLGYLSFDALVTGYPESGQIDFRKINYLIQSHPISYGYSATLFFNDVNQKKQKSTLLAMAPVYAESKGLSHIEDTTLRNLTKLLTPLKYTLQEVQNITSYFSSKSLIGKDATETNFKANSSKYTILHFAMHTIIDDENPLTSKLVFSMEEDGINDGFLNTYEIYNLELNAELAVLSACQTGVGKLNKGEGIMSLARGFLYAGVPGIVMTLWAIEDVSSAEIVTSLYGYLKSGDSKDHALRKAKLDYLDNANQLQAHPYFWAAYVQIGNNAPLTNTKTCYALYLIPALLILIAGGMVLRRFKLRSRLSN